MRIQYEVGDSVFRRTDMTERCEVVTVRKDGVSVKDGGNRTFFLSHHQAIPAAITVHFATMVGPDKLMATDQLSELAANLGAGMTLPEVIDWVKVALDAREETAEGGVS